MRRRRPLNAAVLLALLAVLSGCATTGRAAVAPGGIESSPPVTTAATQPSAAPSPAPRMQPAPAAAADSGCSVRPTAPPPGVRQGTHLHLLPGGVMGLRTDWTPPPQSPTPGHRQTWHPVGSLPAPETRNRKVVIFYTPHPDDETLSMAPLITRAVASGDRVLVVAMSDGLTTGSIRTIDARLARESRPPLTAQQVGAARVAELRHATRDLGVGPGDLFLAHLDDPSSDCGTLVSVGEAVDVMSTFAARYPAATHVTMSDTAERNVDHLACGEALRELVRTGQVPAASWTVSRLWWALPSPPTQWVLPGDASQRRDVIDAVEDYSLWDPGHQSYAIGQMSVRVQFEAQLADPRARVHH